MPVFVAHTALGGQQFFAADKMKCRMEYQGEVIYIILFMFEISMCFVFVLLLLCILLPTWCNNFFPRRRGNDVQDRLDALNEEADWNDAFLPGNIPEQNLLSTAERQRQA